MNNNIIFLTGFMGVGKSATGKELSKILNCKFIDTDSLIEEMYKMKIADIFATKGEDVFRQYEVSIIDKIKETGSSIVSLGGGFVTYKDNIEILKKMGKVVCLTATPEEIYKRVSKENSERPLLKGNNPIEKIILLLQKRAYYYIKSHMVISTNSKQVYEIALEIKKRLNL